MLAGISSGIEPVYQLSYKRRRKVNGDHPNVSFVDNNGDSWEEYLVLHPAFKQYIRQFGTVDESEIDNESLKIWMDNSPWKGSTAYELDPLDRVKMQGAIQLWVDHSISSTVNLPKEATEEDVASIYMEAWKLGLKGITIYRDGSRDGVLVSVDDHSTEDFFTVDAPKRPTELECDIYYTTAQGIPYNVVIGLYNDKPYEVFATTDIMTKERHTKGTLVKIARGHYKVNGININRDKLMEHMSNEYKTITRLISGILRHRAHVKYVVEILHKIPNEDLFSFNKMLARILKKYIKDNEIITGATCTECGSTDLIYKDGCVECNSCGNSKCG